MAAPRKRLFRAQNQYSMDRAETPHSSAKRSFSARPGMERPGFSSSAHRTSLAVMAAWTSAPSLPGRRRLLLLSEPEQPDPDPAPSKPLPDEQHSEVSADAPPAMGLPPFPLLLAEFCSNTGLILVPLLPPPPLELPGGGHGMAAPSSPLPSLLSPGRRPPDVISVRPSPCMLHQDHRRQQILSVDGERARERECVLAGHKERASQT